MKLGLFTAWRHALAKLLFCSLQCKPIAFLTFSLLSPSCSFHTEVWERFVNANCADKLYVTIHDVLTMVRRVFKMAA